MTENPLMVIVAPHYPSAFAAKVANAPLWMIQIPERGVLGPGISGWEPSELKAWTVAASRLPPAPQEPASVDWNSDEAVVRAAHPGKRFGYEATTGTIIRYYLDGTTTTSESLGKGMGSVGAWYSARQHPTVQAYERANRPKPDLSGQCAPEFPPLKRFDLEKVAYGDYAFDHEMREDSNGDWVRIESYDEMLAAKNQEIERLIAMNRGLVEISDKLEKLIDEACDAGEAAESELAALKASLLDSAVVHSNILRGTIALTKSQATHIAGLPADIEEQLDILRWDAARLSNLLKQATGELGTAGAGNSLVGFEEWLATYSAPMMPVQQAAEAMARAAWIAGAGGRG